MSQIKTIDDLLSKEHYGKNANFYELYSSHQFKIHNPRKFQLAFLHPGFHIVFLAFFITWLFDLNLNPELPYFDITFAILTGTYVLSSVFYWIKFNEDAIEEFFNSDIEKNLIIDFEEKFLFNKQVINPILQKIGFQHFSQNDKDSITTMLATKEVNLDTIQFLYEHILAFKKNQILMEIDPQVQAENIQFFAKCH